MYMIILLVKYGHIHVHVFLLLLLFLLLSSSPPSLPPSHLCLPLLSPSLLHCSHNLCTNTCSHNLCTNTTSYVHVYPCSNMMGMRHMYMCTMLAHTCVVVVHVFIFIGSKSAPLPSCGSIVLQMACNCFISQKPVECFSGFKRVVLG